MRFLFVNQRAFLIELASLQATLNLHQAIRQAGLKGIQEIVPAARTLLIYFQPWLTTAAALQEQIQALAPYEADHAAQKQHILEVEYNGEDLAAIAEYCGMSVAELIKTHTETVYTVAFTGFAPGFAYMAAAEHNRLVVPRRSSPRPRIPAGSVALADEFCGIYPQASPGGWQLLGHTDTPMWDLAREPAALLQAGDQVLFKDSQAAKVFAAPSTNTLASIHSVAKQTPAAEPARAALLKVLAPGLQTLIQDQGRHGLLSSGVSESGALDQQAFGRANRLCGNPSHTPALEITQGHAKFQVMSPCVIAITGAITELCLTTGKGSQHILPLEHAFSAEVGDVIELKSTRAGVRNYVAIRDGFACPRVLNSASYDTLARLGPAPLQTEDILYKGDPLALQTVSIYEAPAFAMPDAKHIVTLDIELGPRQDWFTDESLNLLTQQHWQVTATSNRIGVRLQGKTPLSRKITRELPSEGTCKGAIQVPQNGQPVLFLNDHPVTGGYPVIASVCAQHLDLAAQLPPNCHVRFNVLHPDLHNNSKPD
ncbi:urea amidolyase family protein [Brackiella oedipodis]|uniref:5-oxoprolinase subunit B/C family protein n=1 Tax=Brackiella oedipodis TaxID=124225 RepID=UPI00049131C4|nr:urea amidolyase family protein [Brackiella oedipodis]